MPSAMTNLEASDIEYAVKNTFIEYPARRSLSLEGFLHDRETKSCPGSEIMIQRLESLEEDFPTLWGTPQMKTDRLNARSDYIVKNTFIEQEVDYPALRTFSLEEFLKDRETKSCPGSGIVHRLESWEEEPALPDLPIHSARAPVPHAGASADERPAGSEPCPAPALEQRMVSLETEQSQQTLPDTPTAFPSTPVEFPAVPIQGLSIEGLLQATNPFTGTLEQEVTSSRSMTDSTDDDARPAAAPSGDAAARNPCVISLSQQLGVWSAGSLGHEVGYCKPCAFLWKDGCKDGANCDFCHLCPPGEQKRRKKEKLAWRKAVRVARQGMRFGGMV